MSDPLQSAYSKAPPAASPSTPQFNNATAVASPAMNPITLTSAAASSPQPGMIQLLPSSSMANPPVATPPTPASGFIPALLPSASGVPVNSPPANYHHARSQSTFVSSAAAPNGLLGGNFQDLQSLLLAGAVTPGGAAMPSQRLHGSQMFNSLPLSSIAGILATPSASSTTNLISPTTNDYVYPVTSDGYDVFNEIGSGAFSTVYRGVVKETSEDVAIKVIDLDMFNTNWDEIRREIMIMSQLNHPNVVKLKTAFVDGQDLWIVMSYMEAGSCASIMKELNAHNGLKDETAIATILKEVLQALAYFHKHGSIHRDVKAGNILISGGGQTQLADFGVAGTLMEGGDRKKNRQTFTGTPCWMAPEVMEHTESEGYDEKADIWSFGITALEVGYGRAPYAKFPPMKVMLLTLQEEPPTAEIYNDKSYEFSKHYHSMISKCLRRDPKKRPTAKKLLEHKFFQKAADAKYLLEHLVKRLPPRELSQEKIKVRKHGADSAAAKPDGEAAFAGSAEAAYSNTATKAGIANPGAGVKIGSWVFDDSEIECFKKTEGEKNLDLLTGTLQHQIALPHHHSQVRQDIEEGTEEDEDPMDSYDSNTAAPLNFNNPPPQAQSSSQPLQSQSNSSPSLPSTKSALASPLVKPITSEPPMDFFAGVMAPSEDANTGRLSPSAAFAVTGRLSPSAAFAAASSGRLSPSAAFAAVSGTNAAAVAAASPTLSSVQGKTRQFVVQEEIHDDIHVAAKLAASPKVVASSVDLLGDFDLTNLKDDSSATKNQSAAEQFLARAAGETPLLDENALAVSSAFVATGSPHLAADAAASGTSSDPLSLDALSMTPGSATLAYLAAMGSPAEPTPTASTVPAGASPKITGSSSSNSPDQKLNAKPFNAKRASGPLSSLLPLQMPVLKSTPAAAVTNVAAPTSTSIFNSSSNVENLISPTSQTSQHTPDPLMPMLSVNIPSPANLINILSPESTGAASTTSNTNPASTTMGRFQVTQTTHE